MAKKLEDFTVVINMQGWHIRGYRPLSKDQVIEGTDVHPRMLQALKDKETFIQDGVQVRPVCDLKGGKVEELEEAMKAAADKPAPKPAPKAEAPAPKVDKPAMAGADTTAPKPGMKKTPRKAPAQD